MSTRPFLNYLVLLNSNSLKQYEVCLSYFSHSHLIILSSISHPTKDESHLKQTISNLINLMPHIDLQLEIFLYSDSQKKNYKTPIREVNFQSLNNQVRFNSFLAFLLNL